MYVSRVEIIRLDRENYWSNIVSDSGSLYIGACGETSGMALFNRQCD